MSESGVHVTEMMTCDWYHRLFMCCEVVICTVWVKKNPPWGVLTFLIFFTNGWKFLIDFLHTYYTFLSTLD